ncbi:BMP-binding endothelial regulator protein-like [Saccoglossus kowalevskii]
MAPYCAINNMFTLNSTGIANSILSPGDSSRLKFLPSGPPVCIIDGDVHRTFDGFDYTYSGYCTYTMVRDSRTHPTFFVIVEHKFHPDVNARLTEFTVWVKGRHITGRINPQNMQPLFTDENNITISVNDEFQVGPDIVVNYDGHNYEITDRNTLTVIWDGLYRLVITIDKNNLSKIIGMCGNNDGDPGNDLRTRGGILIDLEHSSIEDYARTWEVTNSCYLGFVLA